VFSTLILIGLVFLAPARIKAINDIQITDPQVEYNYGETIVVRATLQAEEAVDEVMLFIKPAGESDAEVVPARLDAQGNVVASYDLRENPLPVFSQVEYRFRVTPRGGEPYTSQSYEFFYEDNRFDWQTLGGEQFQVHWYSGDIVFAQDVLNTAQTGQMRAKSYLPVSLPQSIDIYVYSSAQDLQSTLNLSGQTWVAGHANTDLGAIMVSLPPGPEQQLEMERQIPHEIMHIMLFDTTGDAYTKLPAWFIEGLASIAELYPNPDYAVLLESAYQNNTLIPIAALCNVFPRDASSALLAYAESASFTRFIYEQYGTPGLEELRKQYATGLSCERGSEVALGIALNRLDFRWRQEALAELNLPNLIQNFGPWIMLLIALLFTPLLLIFRSLNKS
jgi:hypothetical protein